MNKIIMSGTLIIILTLIIAAAFFIYERKIKEEFEKEFNEMNDAYKKVLFASGQNKTETTQLMNDYKIAFTKFYSKYRNSPISPYSEDASWMSSLDEMDEAITNSDMLISEGKFTDAHILLEKVRQVWQEIFTRNNVTLLGFYLTEYHENMEKAVAYSDSKDYEGLKTACASMKETLVNIKDARVEFSEPDLSDYNSKLNANIENLNELCNSIESNNELAIKETSSKLKSLFISLYLKYG